MNRVRVAHVTTTPISLRYLLQNQLLTLRDHGFDVVGVSGPGPEIADLAAIGIPHYQVPFTRAMAPASDLAALVSLTRLFRREKFTIVHTHNPKPGLFGQLAARAAGVPIVINTVHGFYFHEHTPRIQQQVYATLERLAGMLSDRVLTQSSEDYQRALELRIASPEKLRHLSNGIDLTRFSPDGFDRTAIRRALGLDEHHKVIGFVGRLVREKGILDLFSALRRIHERVPSVRLLVIGPEDPEKPDRISQNAAQDLGVAELCIFTGLRDDMPSLFAAMDVFALPSYREGVPRSPMEASAMGVPAVVTDIRGCREVVRPGVNGLLVPAGRPELLADAIVEILINPMRARDFGQRGRELAERHFDERNVFETVKNEYVSLLQQRGLLNGSVNGSVVAK